MVKDKYEEYKNEHEQCAYDIVQRFVESFTETQRNSTLEIGINMLKADKEVFGTMYGLDTFYDELIAGMEGIKLSTAQM